jgi:hypothetical protein
LVIDSFFKIVETCDLKRDGHEAVVCSANF